MAVDASARAVAKSTVLMMTDKGALTDFNESGIRKEEGATAVVKRRRLRGKKKTVSYVSVSILRFRDVITHRIWGFA